MFNLFKNKQQNKTAKMLTLGYKNDIAYSIPYHRVKNAVLTKNLSELIAIYKHIIAYDSQISSELNKRKQSLISLPYEIICEEQAQKELLESYCKRSDFKIFLNNLSSAITYGFSCAELLWEVRDGVFIPKTKFIDFSYFDYDPIMECTFLNTQTKRIYIDDTPSILTYLHPSDSGDIVESSLIYKLLLLATLKHIVLSKNMSYFDNLSIPTAYYSK